MEPEYDVPAGQIIQSSQVLADADGNPVIMAQVQMLFALKEKPGPNFPDKKIRNVHTIGFTKQNGDWQPHSFRNIQNGNWSGFGYGYPTHLARGADGNMLAFVWDRNVIGVHALESGIWAPRHKGRFPEDGYYATDFATTHPYVGTSENDAWQAYSFAYTYSGGNSVPRQRISSSERTFALDSIYSFRPLAILSEGKFNMLVGLDEPPPKQTSDPGNPGSRGLNDSLPDLIYYRWSRDPDAPRPSKHVLAKESGILRGFTAVVEGENRFYGRLLDGSIREYAYRDGEFLFLRELSFPEEGGGAPEAGEEDGVPSAWTYASLTVDSQGCLHGIMDLAITASGGKGFVHRNSCSPALDTTLYPSPAPLTGTIYNFPRELVAGADGTVMFVFVLQEIFPWEDDFYSYDTFRPSWLYLARSTPSGKWEIELVTDY